MEDKLYSTYESNLFGYISLDTAKNEVIAHSVYHYFKGEFDDLLQDTSKSSPAELAEIFKDLHGWVDEDFVLRKHQMMEALIFVPSWFNLQAEFIEYYNQCLVERWHHQHEHILPILSAVKSATSPPYIDIALNAAFKYMLLSDDEGFIRKCMWALADIPTEESIQILHKYANDPSEVKRKHANEQLRWLNGEKGMRYMP